MGFHTIFLLSQACMCHPPSPEREEALQMGKLGVYMHILYVIQKVGSDCKLQRHLEAWRVILRWEGEGDTGPCSIQRDVNHLCSTPMLLTIESCKSNLQLLKLLYSTITTI